VKVAELLRHRRQELLDSSELLPTTADQIVSRPLGTTILDARPTFVSLVHLRAWCLIGSACIID